jgi:hypothetical protein
MDEHDDQTQQPAHAGVPDVSMSPGELWQQQNDEAAEQLDQLARTVTQREWLLITRTLDRTRQEIGADSGLTMLALAWAKQKHETGGASWDKLLDLTDVQLEALHGFPPGSREDAEKAAADAAP